MSTARTRADGDESTSNVFNGVDKVTCLLYVPAGSVVFGGRDSSNVGSHSGGG